MTKKSKRAARKQSRRRERECGPSSLGGGKRRRRIKADLSKQAPNNSYDPPEYYEDYTFKCIGCGKMETWTAIQQKQYYEEWKKPIYHKAIMCRACRKQLNREE